MWSIIILNTRGPYSNRYSIAFSIHGLVYLSKYKRIILSLGELTAINVSEKGDNYTFVHKRHDLPLIRTHDESDLPKENAN